MVVARDRPIVRVPGPIRPPPHGGPAPAASRSTRSSSQAASPRASGAACGATAQRQEGHTQRPRPDHGQSAVDLEDRPGRAVGLRGRAPVGAVQALEHLPAGVGDHEPGRNPGRHQRPDHRARRGSDDVLRAGGIPLGLARERIERPGQPSAAEDPARSEHQPDLHRPLKSTERSADAPDPPESATRGLHDSSLSGSWYARLRHGGLTSSSSRR